MAPGFISLPGPGFAMSKRFPLDLSFPLEGPFTITNPFSHCYEKIRPLGDMFFSRAFFPAPFSGMQP